MYLVIPTYSSEAHYRTSADSSLSVLSRKNIGKKQETNNNKNKNKILRSKNKIIYLDIMT